MAFYISSTYTSVGIVLNNPTAQNPATVTNSGLIDLVSGTGIYGAAGTLWTIANFGIVEATLGTAIQLASGGSIDNARTIGGEFGIMFGAGSTGYVVNSGTISGTYQAVTDGFGTIANNRPDRQHGFDRRAKPRHHVTGSGRAGRRQSAPL